MLFHIKDLITNVQFLENVRAYNCMFSMTSFGVEVDDTINHSRDPYVFKELGVVSHLLCSLCPPSEALISSNVHMCDTDNEIANRLRFFSVSNEPQLSSNVVIAREDLEVMELLEFLRKCPDRPKLLFDTVCTLTDMQYVVYHATIIAEGVEASQELYIRHTNGCPVSSEVERERVIHCPEAVIKRQVPEGVKLELCGEDSVVLLSDVSRIFRENGLSITRVEVTMRGYYNFLLLIHHFPYFIN
ncbi:ACT domain-containing protein ACR6 isoform X1 [Helianthus annuus]|uniref:ACT domain-containing protein ACR6 isoform X1 n=1 Tax=Helianthus annuus TaxID=4232 RepID=UPI000B8F43EE|nr:ACT domain-containing protein ACR6 isoform X1 [Helianthus annuus]